MKGEKGVVEEIIHSQNAHKQEEYIIGDGGGVHSGR